MDRASGLGRRPGLRKAPRDHPDPRLRVGEELRTALRSLDPQITTAPRRPGRPAVYGDAHYREIADLYSGAWNAGDRRPTKAVADAKVVARSTAAKWVREARRREFLGPTTPRRPGVTRGLP